MVGMIVLTQAAGVMVIMGRMGILLPAIREDIGFGVDEVYEDYYLCPKCGNAISKISANVQGE